MMPLAIDKHLLLEIDAAKSGDINAFTRIIDQARNTVSSIALAIVKDLDNSEEVAQQVFISVWENLHQLKNNTSFYPWIRQITRYKAYNFLRDNRMDRKISGERAEYLLAQFCDPEESQAEQMERQQQSQILNNFISDLPNESREIVLLYYREERSTKQVAKLLDLSEVNVRQKLSRTRNLLKHQLLDKYGKLILSTMPSVSLSTLIITSITNSAPVAAAGVFSSASAAGVGNSSVLGKVFLVIGGALIGVLGGVFGVVLGANILIRRVNDDKAKLEMRKYRNQTVAWVTTTGLLFALSYEVTSGWILPVVCYLVFAIGLIVFIKRTNRFAMIQLYGREYKAEDIDTIKTEKLWQAFGIIGGLIFGFSGLILGLISSGRMGL